MDTETNNTSNKASLVWITPNAEAIIAEIARVSNPNNQKNPNYTGLIKYLIRNAHWSPFEMANMTIRVVTSRAIAQQILRHRSFSFQEFSQRYSDATEFEPIEIRRQGITNRQSSLEVFNPYLGQHLASEYIQNVVDHAEDVYNMLIEAGVAREVARFILPLNTQTTLYINGSIRSWIHYLEIRDDEHVQKEHRLIAQEIRGIFNQYLPTVAEALAQLKKEQEDKEFLYTLLMEGKIQLP